MNGFRRWFAQMMYGRYGMDELNRFLLILAAVCIVAGVFIFRRPLNFIGMIMLAIVYLRMFSRNIYKRQNENNWFFRKKSEFTSKTSPKGPIYQNGGNGKGGYTTKGNDGKRILICPYCKEKLRVPVGAGKIKIKCPHCSRTFEEVV